MVAIDITPNNDGGVLKEIIKEGVGDETPSAGSRVSVHYTGTLLDGTQFDSSRDRNKPFKFNLKRGNIIKAWDIGVATMKQGEVALFTCAPEYAYGDKGSPPKIPPKATLKFEIEMIRWKGEDLTPNKDGGIKRHEINPGKDWLPPDEGTLVNVHLVGMYNDKVFEDRDVTFSLGEGEDCGVIDGVERALKRFRSGEKSKLTIKSKYAFKNEGKPEFGIPPDATVDYVVELKSFEKAVQSWALKGHEKVEQAKLFKEKGTTYFKANKYNLAIKMYKKITLFLADIDQLEDDLQAEVNTLVLSAHLNLALCYLKTDQNANAKESCNTALLLSPQNEKALFRRGQAYLALASPEIAIKDFQEVLKIEPKNTAAIKQIGVCNVLIKKQLEKEKKLYAHMFDKFAQEDRQKEELKLRQQPDVMRGALGEWGQEERPDSFLYQDIPYSSVNILINRYVKIMHHSRFYAIRNMHNSHITLRFVYFIRTRKNK